MRSDPAVHFLEEQNRKSDVEGHFHSQCVIKPENVGCSHVLLEHGQVDQYVSDEVPRETRVRYIGHTAAEKDERDQDAEPIEGVQAEKSGLPRNGLVSYHVPSCRE